MARRGRGQFQFTITELVVLAGSFTVTAVLVFLLGFYVGRGVAVRHGAPAPQVARVPVGSAPREPEESEAEAAASPAAAKTPERKPPPRVAPPPREPLTKPESKPESTPPAARPTAHSRILGETTQPAATVPPAPPVPYTVQVLATRNRREAEALASELKSKRIGAFVAPVEDASGRWYRVRIGRYDDLQSARAMEGRCRRDFGLDQAYVVPYGTAAR